MSIRDWCIFSHHPLSHIKRTLSPLFCTCHTPGWGRVDERASLTFPLELMTRYNRAQFGTGACSRFGPWYLVVDCRAKEFAAGKLADGRCCIPDSWSGRQKSCTESGTRSGVRAKQGNYRVSREGTRTAGRNLGRVTGQSQQQSFRSEWSQTSQVRT